MQIDRDTLKRMFVDELKSGRIIAEELGYTRNTVSYWLRLYKISAYERPEGLKKTSKYIDSEVLKRLYRKHKSIKVISKITKIGRQTLSKRLKLFGVEILRIPPNKKNISINEVKRLYESGLSCKKIGMKLGVTKRIIRKYVNRLGIMRAKPYKSVLEKQGEYIRKLYESGKTIVEISRELKISYYIIDTVLKKLKVAMRPRHRILGKYSGNKNSNWKGGRSYNPYPFKFDNALKEKIRERDKRQCVFCGLSECDHIKLWRCKNPIHHLDDDKKNCHDNNLVTACHRCNAKAIHHHEEYFRRGKKAIRGLTNE